MSAENLKYFPQVWIVTTQRGAILQVCVNACTHAEGEAKIPAMIWKVGRHVAWACAAYPLAYVAAFSEGVKVVKSAPRMINTAPREYRGLAIFRNTGPGRPRYYTIAPNLAADTLAGIKALIRESATK